MKLINGMETIRIVLFIALAVVLMLIWTAWQKDYGDKVADAIDGEINKIIQQASKTAKKILVEHKDLLVKLATTLITKETIEGDELESMLKDVKTAIPMEEVPPAVVTREPVEKKKSRSSGRRAPLMPPTFPEQAPATSE